MKQYVTGDMNIMEVVERYPIVAHILMRYGLGCMGCIISTAESLNDGIAIHGLNPEDVIEEINIILEMEEEGGNL